MTLVGLGLVTLWRTRRTDGSLLRKGLRRGGLAIAAYLTVMFMLVPIGGAYVFTHVARTPVEDIDLGTDRVEDVAFKTDDGLELEGSYVPSRNGAAVIVAFGRKGSQKHARMLARHGYGVLIFDRRGEGESDGDPNAYAWSDGEKDLDAAVAFVARRPDVDRRRIGASGSRSEASRCSRPPRATARSTPSSPRERAPAPAASSQRAGHQRAGHLGTAITTLGTAIFSNARHRRT